MGIANKKRNFIKSTLILMLLLFTMTACVKRTDFFNNKELKEFGLDNLVAPDNSTNYYNKSNNKMLFCYMNVSKDDDVIKFVMDVLNEFENNNIYKEFGYAKLDDVFEKNRKIYMSKDIGNIENYQIDSYGYSENSVSFNSYGIYYSLADEKKEHTIYNLIITSYTENETIYLSGFNLMISVVKNNYSKYNIVNIND